MPGLTQKTQKTQQMKIRSNWLGPYNNVFKA